MQNQVKAPFVVYADFESVLHHVDISSNSGKSTRYQEHVACSYMYYIVSNIPGIEFEPRMYVGVNAAEHLLNSLQNDLYKQIMPIIERNVEMMYSEEDQYQFEGATICCICQKELNRDTQIVVRDHCHFTGKFRGAAHQVCNLNYKIVERWK